MFISSCLNLICWQLLALGLFSVHHVALEFAQSCSFVTNMQVYDMQVVRREQKSCLQKRKYHRKSNFAFWLVLTCFFTFCNFYPLLGLTQNPLDWAETTDQSGCKML